MERTIFRTATSQLTIKMVFAGMAGFFWHSSRPPGMFKTHLILVLKGEKKHLLAIAVTGPVHIVWCLPRPLHDFWSKILVKELAA